jgi:hypothetical protein
LKYKLILPDDFDDYEWEVSAKGYFAGARLVVNEVGYRLNFYDPARLQQEIESEAQRGVPFFEPNLVIVRTLTRFDLEQAAEWLVTSGQVAFLMPGSNDPQR